MPASRCWARIGRSMWSVASGRTVSRAIRPISTESPRVSNDVHLSTKQAESDRRHPMRPRSRTILNAALLTLSFLGATARADDEGWTPLFDGKTLDGWAVRG